MFLFLKKYRFRISIGIIIFSFFLILIGQVEKGRAENFATSVLQVITYPFIAVSDWASDNTKETWRGYFWLVGVEKENLELKQELNRLREVEANYLELHQSYQRLVRNLEFQESNPDSKVFAQVIGERIDSFSRLLIINKGSNHGIKKNFAVVTPFGVVGKIQKVTPYQSVVQLISDARSNFPVLVQRTRSKAMIQGDLDGTLSLSRFPRDTDIEIGDEIITSGMAGIFPKGFPIGKVSKVEKKEFGLFQRITVTPSTDLNRIEEVAIILYSPGNLIQPLFTEEDAPIQAPAEPKEEL